MKPALSPAATGFLPSLRARSCTSSTTSGSVTTVRITSTNFCTGAGLKKCMPMTRPGLRGRRRDLGDRQRRRVGGEHGVGADDLVELLEDRALEVEVLDDRLDHEVAVLEVGQRWCVRVSRSKIACCSASAELAPLDGAVGGVLDVGAAALDLLVGLLDADRP